jgi:hypothetical protein
MENSTNKKTIQSFVSYWMRKIQALQLIGGKCQKCGNSYPLCLTFHHIDDRLKSGNVSEMLKGHGSSTKFNVISEEVKKCIVLCANCHCEMHTIKTYPLKEKILNLKGAKSCQKCGYSNTNNLSSLDFHHIDPKEKEFKISDKYYHYSGERFTLPIEKIIQEMDKCEVLCKNCHIIEHSNHQRFEELKEFIYKRVEKNRPQNYLEKNKEEIIKMYKDGARLIDIRYRFKCSYEALNLLVKKLISSKIIKERSLSSVKRKKRSNKTDAYIEKIINMYICGHTLKVIAKEFSISEKTVLNILSKERKNGTKIPRRWTPQKT